MQKTWNQSYKSQFSTEWWSNSPKMCVLYTAMKEPIKALLEGPQTKTVAWNAQDWASQQQKHQPACITFLVHVSEFGNIALPCRTPNWPWDILGDLRYMLPKSVGHVLYSGACVQVLEHISGIWNTQPVPVIFKWSLEHPTSLCIFSVSCGIYYQSL